MPWLRIPWPWQWPWPWPSGSGLPVELAKISHYHHVKRGEVSVVCLLVVTVFESCDEIQGDRGKFLPVGHSFNKWRVCNLRKYLVLTPCRTRLLCTLSRTCYVCMYVCMYIYIYIYIYIIHTSPVFRQAFLSFSGHSFAIFIKSVTPFIIRVLCSLDRYTVPWTFLVAVLMFW
jgi:hypothetical protein